MAVREFDGTDDTMHHAVDVLSGMTFGTMASITKYTTSETSSKWAAALHTSGGTFRAAILGHVPDDTGGGDRFQMHNGIGDSSSGNNTFPVSTWFLCVVRKGTGTVAPRFSLYNMGTPGWTHVNGASTLADWTSAAAGGTVRTEAGGSEFFEGRIAVRAIWSNAVHWSADATGDSQIEAAGLETSLQNWVDETPDALWRFDQASTATPCDDLINNCDQSSLTGTTVVAGDDPPSFSFDLGPGPVAPNLRLTRSNLQLR